MLIITVSNLAAGVLADATGARVAIAVFAGLGLVAGTAYLVLTRGVRVALATQEQHPALI